MISKIRGRAVYIIHFWSLLFGCDWIFLELVFCPIFFAVFMMIDDEVSEAIPKLGGYEMSSPFWSVWYTTFFFNKNHISLQIYEKTFWWWYTTFFFNAVFHISLWQIALCIDYTKLHLFKAKFDITMKPFHKCWQWRSYTCIWGVT